MQLFTLNTKIDYLPILEFSVHTTKTEQQALYTSYTCIEA